MKKDNAGYKVVVAQLPNEYGRVVMLIFTAEMHVLLDSKNKCYPPIVVSGIGIGVVSAKTDLL